MADEARDPAVAIPLLWRNDGARLAELSARGPRQRSSVDAVVSAAIEIADAEGLDAVSMRRVADRLGLGAMSVYTYVPSKPVLVDLMFDSVTGEGELPPHPESLRDRLGGIARRQWEEYRRHPWLLLMDSSRPALGPNVSRRWEWQLEAVEGYGLSDIEMDQVVTLVTTFVAGPARMVFDAARTRETSGLSDPEWWAATAPELEKVMNPGEFPLSGRVGQSAGATYDGAVYPDLSYQFGLDRILDGVESYVATLRSGA